MRICYVVNRLPEYGGSGAELQVFLIGQELKKRGHEIHFAVTASSPKLPRTVGGMKIHQAGSRRRNALNPIYGLLEDADCDIYLQRCAGTSTYYTSDFCRKNGRIFVFNAACIFDCQLGKFFEPPELINGKFIESAVKRQLYLRGLRGADAIVVLANYMKAELETHIDKPIFTIRSGHPIPKKIWPKADKPSFLWVGRYTNEKHPEIFERLAQELPDFSFRMVTGGIPHGEMAELYGSAWAFISTSEMEGFPNTWIESWLQGTPVLSYGLNIDGLLSPKSQLGEVAKDFPYLKGLVVEIARSRNNAIRRGSRARKIAVKMFNISNTAKMHENLYKRLLARRKSSSLE